MLWWAIVIEALVFAGIFTSIVLPAGLSDKKYSPSSIHGYLPDIQEEYFKTHERVDVSNSSKKVILTKSLGVFMFCVILFISALLAGANTFLQGFLLSFGLMIWIGLYDTLFIDWVLFANIKGFRQKFHHADGNSLRFDVLTCPYVRYTTELGCPEIAHIFCENDIYAYAYLKGIVFERTQTLGTGGTKCDFNLYKTK